MKNHGQPFLTFIDDDTVFQFTAKILLKKKFNLTNILLFNNGKEAFDYIETNKSNQNILPEIVFVDINMPVMNGWEFIERITPYSNSLLKGIEVYLVSSSIDQRDINKSKEYELIKEFISKPLSMSTFEKLLANKFEPEYTNISK